MGEGGGVISVLEHNNVPKVSRFGERRFEILLELWDEPFAKCKRSEQTRTFGVVLED